MDFQLRSKTPFIEREIIRETEGGPYNYRLLMPDFLASWDVYDYWERERLKSMHLNITEGDVVFDVGAEHGWLSALISKYMSSKIVLFEPTPEFWPNIKAIYEENNLRTPLGCVPNLVGENVKDAEIYSEAWPEVAEGEYLIPKNSYKYIHENNGQIGEITITYYCLHQLIKPDVINIDVEGAELQVISGALSTILEYKPLLWISIHPDLMQRDYNNEKYNDRPDKLHDLLDRIGYEGKLLDTDHEEHWFYYPKEKANEVVW